MFFASITDTGLGPKISAGLGVTGRGPIVVTPQLPVREQFEKQCVKYWLSFHFAITGLVPRTMARWLKLAMNKLDTQH